MEIFLNNRHWQLKGFWPYVPLREENIGKGVELMGVTDWIPATVPGGVHYDLFRAGLIEQPYIDMNSFRCEWVENRWWAYRTSFERPENMGEKAELVFKGLDYDACVYLNGVLLGEHEGMYEPAVFDVTGLIRENEKLELVVLFKNAPQEMNQIGRTSLTHTQKSRFNYKWDFSTRMVNIGIWDDVLLDIHDRYSIEDVYAHTDVAGDMGLIQLEFNIRCCSSGKVEGGGLKLAASCHAPDGSLASRCELPVCEGVNKLSIEVEGARLWYPNGYGEQPLYGLELCLSDGSGILDTYELQTGIRKLGYVRNEGSPENALPYTFVVNGRKIYVRGVNMTPLDHIYGNVTASHYEQIIRQMKLANVNLVRVWGGGIIEKEVFYKLCDTYGILIWQEFIQSSSGIDNIPSKRPEFLALLKKTAIAALKGRRSHVALTVWSGGNELMSGPDTPSTFEDENIAMLKGLVEEFDPIRLFLPTSASGPVEFITTRKGVSHDVHGHWTYQGNPGHYELYRQSDSLFHSEFGVDGVSSVKSLRKFLSPAYLKPAAVSEDLVWRHHGEWWDTLARDKAIFGDICDIGIFSDCSQWMQAEGLRFIVEANRRRQFKNSGSIIWQLNEPWPNTSCTNLVDYYGEPKMAYYWVRTAYAPVAASLDYKRLDYHGGERFEGGIYVCCNAEPAFVKVAAKVMGVDGRVLSEKEYSCNPMENEVVRLGDLSFMVGPDHGQLFFVSLEVSVDGSEAGRNLYVFSTMNEAIYSPALELSTKLPPIRLEIVPQGEWKEEASGRESGNFSVLSRDFLVRNSGGTAALHIRPEETTNSYWTDIDRGFFTLFPGEEKKVKVTCTVKNGGGFPAHDRPEAEGRLQCPDISFRCFGMK